MRLLHTSDWHIGKRLFERERLPEQIAALRYLARICDEKKVDVVLVAGDVFDTFMPSADAEEAFFRVAKELAGERRALVAVSGNHDDGVRLSASSPLAAEEGIYLFGGSSSFIPEGTRPVHAVYSDGHALVLENEAKERVHINALPYPNEARLREEKTEESYAEKVSRWIKEGEAGSEGLPKILLSHLFVAGSQTSESERDIMLGGARAVPHDLFPKDCYVALGHIHKRQSFGENVRYSGSLLQYSFDESPDKSVYLLETEGTSVRVVEQIPIEGGKRLTRLECSGVEEAVALLPRYENDFIELTIHLTEPLSTAETAALNAANAGLVSLLTKVESKESFIIQSRSTLGDGELFDEYCRTRWGEEPSAELRTAFLKLLSEEE